MFEWIRIAFGFEFLLGVFVGVVLDRPLTALVKWAWRKITNWLG